MRDPAVRSLEWGTLLVWGMLLDVIDDEDVGGGLTDSNSNLSLRNEFCAIFPNRTHRRLGVNAVEGSGEGDGFADVVEAADPGYDSLDAHAEAGVGDAAVFAQVEVPLEGVEGQVVFFDAGLQEVVAVDALASRR